MNKLRGFLTSCFKPLRRIETTLRNDKSWGWVVEFQGFALVMTKYWRSNSSQSMHTDIARRAKDHSEGAKRSGAPRSLYSASVKIINPPLHWKAPALSKGVGGLIRKRVVSGFHDPRFAALHRGLRRCHPTKAGFRVVAL